MLVELGMQLAGRMVSRTPETQGSVPSTTAFISFIIAAMKPNKSNLRKMGLFWRIVMANSRQRELGAVGHMSSITKKQRWMNAYCSTFFIHSSRSESQLGGRGESTIHRGRVFMPRHDQGSPPQVCPGAHLPADSRSCHIENTNIPLSVT